MKGLAALCIASSVAIPAFASAAAQQPTYGSISGIVVTAMDSVRLSGAEIRVDSSPHAATTDAHGAFTLADVPAGQHVVQVRRLGYLPNAVVATVTAGGRTNIVVGLERSAQPLPEVTIHGQRVVDLPRFTEAVERAARNSGAVFTADQIRRENLPDTKSLLERLPGVHANDRSITFDRCQDSGTLGQQHDIPKVSVYVDGVRVTRDSPPGGFEPDDANGILTRMNPRSIAVMEVYTGIARIPAEYLADACAVIVIWTKAY